MSEPEQQQQADPVTQQREAIDPRGLSAPPPPPPWWPAAPAAPARRGGWIGRLFGGLVGTVLIGSIVLNVYLAIMVAALTSGPSEAVYTDGDADHRVVILPISGMIDDEMAEFVRKSLGALAKDPPAAVVLRVESGGGTVTASDHIWHQLEQFKQQQPGMKIVASFGGIAASGGYYVATPADFIMSDQTGITGSIGVMAPVYTFAGLIDKIGVMDQTLVASGSPKKEVGNTITRTWDENDKAVIRRLLDSHHARFVDVVAAGRSGKLTREQVQQLADGRIFTAVEAEANQLIDGIGYLDAAVAKAAEMAGVPAGVQPKVTLMRQPQSLGLGALLWRGDSGEVRVEMPAPEQVRSWATEMTWPRASYLVQWK